MKYFISNKLEKYLDFKKISVEEFLVLPDESKIDGVKIFAGTFESLKDPSLLLKKIKSITNGNSSVDLSFINIYQMFVDAAYFRLDVGIAHLVCKSIEKPFNTNAAVNFIKENNININKLWFEENSTILRVDCTNE